MISLELNLLTGKYCIVLHGIVLIMTKNIGARFLSKQSRSMFDCSLKVGSLTNDIHSVYKIYLSFLHSVKYFYFPESVATEKPFGFCRKLSLFSGLFSLFRQYYFVFSLAVFKKTLRYLS